MSWNEWYWGSRNDTDMRTGAGFAGSGRRSEVTGGYQHAFDRDQETVDNSRVKTDDSSLSVTVKNDQYRSTLGRERATGISHPPPAAHFPAYREPMPVPPPVTEIVQQTGRLLSKIDDWNPISLQPRRDLASASSQSAAGQPSLVNISKSKYATLDASSSLAQTLIKNIELLGKAFSSSTVTYSPNESITASARSDHPSAGSSYFASSTGYGDRVSGSSMVSSKQKAASTGESFSLKYRQTPSSGDQLSSSATSSTCDPVIADVLKSIGFNFDLSKFGSSLMPKEHEQLLSSSVQHSSISYIPPQPVPPPVQAHHAQSSYMAAPLETSTVTGKMSETKIFSDIDRMLQKVRDKRHSRSPAKERVRSRSYHRSSSESEEDVVVKKSARLSTRPRQRQFKEESRERSSGRVQKQRRSPSPHRRASPSLWRQVSPSLRRQSPSARRRTSQSPRRQLSQSAQQHDTRARKVSKRRSHSRSSSLSPPRGHKFRVYEHRGSPKQIEPVTYYEPMSVKRPYYSSTVSFGQRKPNDSEWQKDTEEFLRRVQGSDPVLPASTAPVLLAPCPEIRLESDLSSLSSVSSVSIDDYIGNDVRGNSNKSPLQSKDQAAVGKVTTTGTKLKEREIVKRGKGRSSRSRSRDRTAGNVSRVRKPADRLAPSNKSSSRTSRLKEEQMKQSKSQSSNQSRSRDGRLSERSKPRDRPASDVKSSSKTRKESAVQKSAKDTAKPSEKKVTPRPAVPLMSLEVAAQKPSQKRVTPRSPIPLLEIKLAGEREKWMDKLSRECKKDISPQLKRKSDGRTPVQPIEGKTMKEDARSETVKENREEKQEEEEKKCEDNTTEQSTDNLAAESGGTEGKDEPRVETELESEEKETVTDQMKDRPDEAADKEPVVSDNNTAEDLINDSAPSAATSSSMTDKDESQIESKTESELKKEDDTDKIKDIPEGFEAEAEPSSESNAEQLPDSQVLDVADSSSTEEKKTDHLKSEIMAIVDEIIDRAQQLSSSPSSYGPTEPAVVNLANVQTEDQKQESNDDIEEPMIVIENAMIVDSVQDSDEDTEGNADKLHMDESDGGEEKDTSREISSHDIDTPVEPAGNRKHSQHAQLKPRTKMVESKHSERSTKDSTLSGRRRARERSNTDSVRSRTSEDRRRRTRERYQQDVDHSQHDAKGRSRRHDSSEKDLRYYSSYYYPSIPMEDNEDELDLEQISSDDENVRGQHHGKYDCQLCDEVFDTESVLLHHCLSYHDRPITSALEKPDRPITSSLENLQSATDKEVVVKKKPFDFESHHITIEDFGVSPFFCGAQFITVVRSPLYCQLCRRSFRNADEANYHLRKSAKHRDNYEQYVARNPDEEMLTSEKRRSPSASRKRRSMQRDYSNERRNKRRRSENYPKHLHLSKLAAADIASTDEEKPPEVKVLSDDLTQLVAEMVPPEKRRSPNTNRKRRSMQRDDWNERRNRRRRSENYPKHLHLSKLAADIASTDEEKPPEVKVMSDDLTQLVAEMVTSEKRRSSNTSRKRRSMQRYDWNERHNRRRRSENVPKHLHLSKVTNDIVSLTDEEKPAELKVMSDDLTQLVAAVTGQKKHIELDASDISDEELIVEEGNEPRDFVREILEHIIGQVTPEDFVREIIEHIIDQVTLDDFVREIIEHVIDEVTSDVSQVDQSDSLSSTSLHAVVDSGENGSDVGNEGMDREVNGTDEPTGMSLEEDVLSNDSTVSYAGSDVMMKSVVGFEEGCILAGSDWQTEGSNEAEMGSDERWSYGDQRDEKNLVQDGDEGIVSEARAVSESVGDEDVEGEVMGSGETTGGSSEPLCQNVAEPGDRNLLPTSDDITDNVPPAADHEPVSETVVGDGDDAEKNLLPASEVIIIDCESVLPIVIEDDDEEENVMITDNVPPAGDHKPMSETVTGDGDDAEKSLLPAPEEIIIIDGESVPHIVIKDDDDDDDDRKNLLSASVADIALVTDDSVSQSAAEDVNLLSAPYNIVVPFNEGEVVSDSARSDGAEEYLLPASDNTVGEELSAIVGEAISESLCCEDGELNLLPTSDNIVPPVDNSDLVSEIVHADDAEESLLSTTDDVIADVSTCEAACQSAVEDDAENSSLAHDETVGDIPSVTDGEVVLEHVYDDVDKGDNLLPASDAAAAIGDREPLSESVDGNADVMENLLSVSEDIVADIPSVNASEPMSQSVSGDGDEQNLSASDAMVDDDDFEIDIL